MTAWSESWNGDGSMIAGVIVTPQPADAGTVVLILKGKLLFRMADGTEKVLSSGSAFLYEADEVVEYVVLEDCSITYIGLGAVLP